MPASQCICLPGWRQAGCIGAKTIPVLMVSDIHFEPFWDPAKTQQLAAAPVAQWNAILAAAPTPGREQSFASLQQTCHAKGVDTSYTLFASSLSAMRADAGGARFITVSGDLMAHQFLCKYDTIFPRSARAAYSAFAAKTVEYVLMELRDTFPACPCMRRWATTIPIAAITGSTRRAAFWTQPAEPSPRTRSRARRSLARQNRRLRRAAITAPLCPLPCGTRGCWCSTTFLWRASTQRVKTNPIPRLPPSRLHGCARSLKRAQQSRAGLGDGPHPAGCRSVFDRERDTERLRRRCAGDVSVVRGSAADAGGVWRRGATGHFCAYAYGRVAFAVAGRGHEAVAVKLVPSISPVVGNNPSFTVAWIVPETAVMTGYRVVAASNQIGRGYEVGGGIRLRDGLMARRRSHLRRGGSDCAFQGRSGSADQGQPELPAQIDFVSDRSEEIKSFWPLYEVCTLGDDSAASLKACECPAAP